jgi:hypothetical protein
MKHVLRVSKALPARAQNEGPYIPSPEKDPGGMRPIVIADLPQIVIDMKGNTIYD